MCGAAWASIVSPTPTRGLPLLNQPAMCSDALLERALLRENDQMERGVPRLAGRIEGLNPDAFIVIERRIGAAPRAATQRHGDFAGGLGGDPGSADGGDECAVADFAGEEDLIDTCAQMGGTCDAAAAHQVGVAVDHRPKLSDATIFDSPPRIGRRRYHWICRPWRGRRRRPWRGRGLEGGLIRSVHGIRGFSFCVGCHCTFLPP